MKSLPKNPMSSRVRALRGIALTLSTSCAVLLLASAASAQVSGALPGKTKAVTAQTAAVAGSAAPARAATPSAPRGEHEGITVHGRWVIEVRNPDGTVTARREFENSLQASGTTQLINLLTGNDVAGTWTVLLNGSGNQPSGGSGNPGTSGTASGPCLPIKYSINGVKESGGPSTGGECIITVPPNSSGQGDYWSIACANDISGDSPEPCSLNLVVASTGSGITLTGTVPVTSAAPGTVNDVETALEVCANDSSNAVPPANCAAALTSAGTVRTDIPLESSVAFTPEFFTRAIFGLIGVTPITVNPGQTIAVSVTLSFQ